MQSWERLLQRPNVPDAFGLGRVISNSWPFRRLVSAHLASPCPGAFRFLSSHPLQLLGPCYISFFADYRSKNPFKWRSTHFNSTRSTHALSEQPSSNLCIYT